MRIIKESDAVSLVGNVLALSEKLYSRKRAEQIAAKKCQSGKPLLCEYEVRSRTGRIGKRYLPLSIDDMSG